MPGNHITDRQVRRFMDERIRGKTQAIAAARAGFSESTARRIEGRRRALMSQRPPRRYRTRVDPFQEVWRAEIVPILERSPGIRATTVLEELQRLHPGRYQDRVLRTLQRHIAHWRATEGPERDLIFRQDHPPGRQALSDFTHPNGFSVTIAGRPFKHMLYHFWLAFSGWQHVRAVQGGESFTALTEGLQEALWQLGGSPHEHRTDRLSAAYRNLTDREDEAPGATPSSVATMASSRPATMPALPTRTARSKQRMAISSARSKKRLSFAARTTSPILRPIKPSSPRRSPARMHAARLPSRSSSRRSTRCRATARPTSRSQPPA
jgi:hypothetical protein